MLERNAIALRSICHGSTHEDNYRIKRQSGMRKESYQKNAGALVARTVTQKRMGDRMQKADNDLFRKGAVRQEVLEAQLQGLVRPRTPRCDRGRRARCPDDDHQLVAGAFVLAIFGWQT
jgi:hypothetical protein